VILDATSLSHYQACKRRHVLESQFRTRRWRPRLLFEHWLRRGVHALSNGADAKATYSHTKAGLLAACASPGLDLPSAASAYVQAKDWAAALDTVLRAASRLTLLALRDQPPATIAPGVRWRFSSPTDESGTLHRWIAVSSWDEDELARQAHGWWSFGDMVVARHNLMLHIVEVGSLSRKGRRDSCWTRAYRHPTMHNLRLMFRRSDGTEAFGGRVPVYLADLPNQDADDWVAQLYQCGLAQEKMRHITLACPGDQVCEDSVEQILQEARNISALDSQAHESSYSQIPMSHSACDGLVPCPLQAICYHPRPMTEEEILATGLYDPRNPPVERAASAPVAVQPSTPLAAGR
jgi:hypothetical protein